METLNCFKITKKGGLAGMALLLSPIATFAQQQPTINYMEITFEEVMLGIVIFMTAAVILSLGGLLIAFYALRKSLTIVPSPIEQAKNALQPSFWEKWNHRLTDAVPVEREHEVMTDHEYDGIVELDNSLPPWWKALFAASIVFALVYMSIFHIFGFGELQAEEYETEMTEAKARIDAYIESKGGALNETNVTYLNDDASISLGKSIYDSNCAACHGSALQGTVGPNLTDAYWLHGGSVGDIFKVIRDGVPAKGMIAWKGQLSPSQIQQVTSYIISKEGSDPANPKEPQGDFHQR
ncbi:cbb3-type cytochrome c oxidase N-terminal domain-containing protein [Anditalea andensis]|uniref:Cytochrome C oxidase subunit III n=1 Tax=Anditalea andensis TaxID=1048983 RepID=A0A074L457_9BACT|nr:cbb3-type cytochrome c oxidase N-terminal domain-containing protein [Anditalea andensis]KEO75260.1 cytochrome C oxidase subunit III [Anditalea andensis]